MKTQIKQRFRQACDKLTVIFLKYLRVSPSRTKNLLCQTLSTFFFLNRNPFLWPEEGGGGGGRSVISHDVRWQMIPDGVTMSCDVRMHHMTSQWCQGASHDIVTCDASHDITMMSGCITWRHRCQDASHDVTDVRMHHMTSWHVMHHMTSHGVRMHHMMPGDITWCHVRSSDMILHTTNMMLIISLMPFSHEEKGLVMIKHFFPVVPNKVVSWSMTTCLHNVALFHHHVCMIQHYFIGLHSILTWHTCQGLWSEMLVTWSCSCTVNEGVNSFTRINNMAI